MTVSETLESNSVTIWILIIVGCFTLIGIIKIISTGPSYKKKNRIDGKVVIVTGCNTGIGMETVLELAKRGGKIYMGCRNYDKCERARIEIIKRTGNENVFNRTLDLSSLDSIRKFVENFLNEEQRLDILVNNAGVAPKKKLYTFDGYEMHFGVNHLGHFYLTTLLLDRLKASAPSRIVVVSSEMYIFGRIKKNDIQNDKRYIGIFAYGDSKLANVLFTTQLAKKLNGTGVTINCCTPGMTKSEIGRDYMGKWSERVMRYLLWPLIKSTRAGAQTQIRLALDPNLEGVSGKFFMQTYLKMPILPKGKDDRMGEWLWNKSEDLINEKMENFKEQQIV